MGLFEEEEALIPPAYHDLTWVFEEREADKPPLHHPTDCAIDLILGGNYLKRNCMSQVEKEELHKYLDKNLAWGFTSPTTSPHATPVMFARKKDGGLHLWIDYRGLNAVSMANAYPLCLIKDLLQEVSRGKIFTKLDLRDAYHRVWIKEGDE